MKSTIVLSQEVKKSQTYPYLGQSKYYPDLIVFFTSPGVGTAVHQDRYYPLGTTSATWNEGTFKPFEHQIVLSNENFE